MRKNNFRHCPALQRDITSKECGNDRHSRIPCTADCPFNPFSLENYDDLLLLEKAAESASTARLLRSMTPARNAVFVSEAQRLLDDPFGLEDAFRREVFHRLGPDGLNFLSRWEASGWAGLKNDHRIYFQGHRQLAPMLVEYQGPLDTVRAHAIDLLQGNGLPLLIADRTLASSTPRFSSILVWQFPLPHYYRFFGVNLLMCPLGSCILLETVNEIVHHLGGPIDPDGLLSWLSLNFLHFAKAYQDSLIASNETRERLADRRRFTSTWTYTCPLDVLFSHCNASPLLTGDWPTSEEENSYTAAYYLLAPSADLATFQEMLGANIAGRLLISSGKIRGFAVGEANHRHLRDTVELAAGFILSGLHTEIEELPRREPARAAFDRAGVPARFTESFQPHVVRVHPIPLDDPDNGDSSYQILGEILTKSYRAFVDATPPELGGLTVRDAAALPAHRPAVTQIIKRHYNSLDRLCGEKGYVIDIDDLVTELGLPELIYGQPTGLYNGEAGLPDQEEEWQDEDDIRHEAPEIAALPALLKHLQELAGPFSEEEVKSFRHTATRPVLTPEAINFSRSAHMSRDAKAIKKLVRTSEAQWSLLHGTLLDYFEVYLSEIQENLFFAETMELTSILFPHGPPATPIQPRRLLYHLIGEAVSYQNTRALNIPAALKDWITKNPQPTLCAAFVSRLVTLPEKGEIEVSHGEVLDLLPLLKAVLIELCHLPEF